MKLKWGTWLYGLVSGFIGGGASAITASVVLPAMAPDTFNFSTGLHKMMLAMGAFFILHGVLTAMAYLSKSPLPQVETTVTVATTTQPGVPPQTTTTVSATTQDAAMPPPLKDVVPPGN